MTKILKPKIAPRTIIGRVKKGQRLGDKIGLKTANLNIELAKKFKKGLYTCQIVLNKKTYKGLLYYGYNSLSNKDCLEIHISNFNKNIYRKKITVTINRYLRSPKKFASIEKLAEQVKKDLNSVIRYS